MQEENAFKIYNASAGSGKTYTLVKDYIKKLLTSKEYSSFKTLLAITFTNKAVAEMKQRILNTLVTFSDPLITESELLQEIANDLNKPISEVKRLSKIKLHAILHQFGGFSIETIDHFNHRIIRTFAKDLKLSSNFEVCLDQLELLEEAVAQVVHEIGNDKDLTPFLITYALTNTDNDKSWDIVNSINNTSKILLSENGNQYVKALKNISLKDFIVLQKTIQKELESITKSIQQIGLNTVDKIHNHNLNDNGLFGSFYNFMIFSSSGSVKNEFDSKWQIEIEDKLLYLKKASPEVQEIIKQLSPEFKKAFLDIKEKSYRYSFLKSVLQNSYPLAVVNSVKKEFNALAEERNLVPISYFNTLINKELKSQPVPFIYERLGEKYQHFFIDEFQDTSQLQWENLIPLLDNALAQEFDEQTKGSLLLVGDTKQSIYRWRGGLPEQFADLCEGKTPFSHTKQSLIQLDTNYRSFSQIVAFNNTFFTWIAQFFNDPTHENSYLDGNKQKQNAQDGGYIEISFLDSNEPQLQECYEEKVYETIYKLIQDGYSLSDICILTRKKNKGIEIGKYLSARGIKIISSETLLLAQSKEVLFLIALLSVSLSTKNQKAKHTLLAYIYNHFTVNEERHTFIKKGLQLNLFELEKYIATYCSFSFSIFSALGIYECFEYAIQAFRLQKKSDAFVYGFMDFVFEYHQKNTASKNGLLTWWDQKKDSASLATAKSNDAVQIMTIHKAKGLEFPIVIFPFANEDVYYEKESKLWAPWNDTTTAFKDVLINFNKTVEHYKPFGKEAFISKRNTQLLDNINLLYVTFTRPVEQLYILTDFKKTDAKKQSEPKLYSDFLKRFLQDQSVWTDNQDTYSFGTYLKRETAKEVEILPQNLSQYPSENILQNTLSINKKAIEFWETDTLEAITLGNILHDVMMHIETPEDIEKAFRKTNLDISSEIYHVVTNIVSHPSLKKYFNGNDIIKTEQDIVTAQGDLVRPDRINIHSSTAATVIDYKTGSERTSHQKQITIYQDALKDLGYMQVDKIIIYCSKNTIYIK